MNSCTSKTSSARRSLTFGFVLCLVICGALPSRAQYTPTANEQAYITQFINYFVGLGQQNFPPYTTLNGYVKTSLYDSYYLGSYTSAALNTINTIQNQDSDMAWGDSYYQLSLDSLYRVTSNIKYLQTNLSLTQAAFANRDVDLGRALYYHTHAPSDLPATDPAWGCSQYSNGNWVVDAVHTGMITWGIGEFLNILKANPALQTQLGISPSDFDTYTTKTYQALHFHDYEWHQGPGTNLAADEGYYKYHDEIASQEGLVFYDNQLGAMGSSAWQLWKLTSSTVDKTRALEIANYLKRRTGQYSDGTPYGNAWFWNYDIRATTYSNPRPWAERLTLESNCGEDLSHASISASFPINMGLEGQVWTSDDLNCYANTVTRGFGRMGNNVLFGNVVGVAALDTTNPSAFGPNFVQTTSFWLKLSGMRPDVYDLLSGFYLHYQLIPSHLDLAYLIEFRPPKDVSVSAVKNFNLYQ